MNNKINFAFFGSSRFSVLILDELERAGYIPDCIVTTPDKPKGRKLILTPTPVKLWAEKRNIPALSPAKLDTEFSKSIGDLAQGKKWDLFIVASYGKIIPNAVIDIPTHKTLNVHPSLLPQYRGASPLQSAMLDDMKNTGVSIMKIDAEMDHGPIISQEIVSIEEWPSYEDFEEMMAKKGGQLLAKILSEWIAGTIQEKTQDHSKATFTRKITKENGLIDLADDPYANFRKIQAFHEWPQAYFIHKHNGKEIHVKITQASYTNSNLNIEKLIPEGGKEISFDDFRRGYTS